MKLGRLSIRWRFRIFHYNFPGIFPEKFRLLIFRKSYNPNPWSSAKMFLTLLAMEVHAWMHGDAVRTDRYFWMRFSQIIIGPKGAQTTTFWNFNCHFIWSHGKTHFSRNFEMNRPIGLCSGTPWVALYRKALKWNSAESYFNYNQSPALATYLQSN